MSPASDLSSRMKDEIVLERYDDQARAWFPFPTPAKLWAEMTALGQEQYRFAIRWRPDLQSASDVEPATRILWDDRTLDILDVTEVVRRIEVQLVAKGRQIDYETLDTGARRKASWPS
jgi:hypothetical protein